MAAAEAPHARPDLSRAPAGRSGRGTRAGAVALWLVAVSVVLLWVTGLLGPSAAQPPLGRAPGEPSTWPPVHLAADPSPWLVVALLAAAYGIGAAGMLVALRGIARGWRPDLRRLLAAAAVAVGALVVVPPIGSADHLSYAAYGRIAVAGDDPYVEAPALWRGGSDPVSSAVEPPWHRAPSVYGPVATAGQALASALGGESVAATVGWIALFNGLAFLSAGVLLLRLAGNDPARRARATLLWSLNPLLLGLLVAGAHVDAVAVALAVGGLAALRRHPVLAGALLAAAVGTKVSLALFGLAAAWALRGQPGRVVRLAVGAALVLLPAYATAGPQAAVQVRQASRYVSLASPWNLLVEPLDRLVGFGSSRGLIGLASAALTAVLVLALARLATARPPPAACGEAADPTPDAARAAVLLCGAWLLAAPYTLPWYDAALWAPLALLPASRVDLIAVARTAALALAYVPGRVEVPGAVADPTLWWRGEVTPWFGFFLVAAVLIAAARSPGPPVMAGRRPRPRPAPTP